MSEIVPPPGARIGLLFDDDEEELTVVVAPPVAVVEDFLRGIVVLFLNYCVV